MKDRKGWSQSSLVMSLTSPNPPTHGLQIPEKFENGRDRPFKSNSTWQGMCTAKPQPEHLCLRWRGMSGAMHSLPAAHTCAWTIPLASGSLAFRFAGPPGWS